MIQVVTGHRPQRLGGFDPDNYIMRFIKKRLTDTWAQRRPERIYTGMALGWDILVAKAAAMTLIPYVAFVPFPGQEKLWSAEAQRDYNFYLSMAESVVMCHGYEPVDRDEACRLLLARDSQMLSHAVGTGRPVEVLACFDGQKFGGTWHTIKVAKSKGLPVEIIDPRVVRKIGDAPLDAVYVGRDARYGETLFGNPWSHLDRSSAPFHVDTVFDAIEMHVKWLQGELPEDPLPDLRQRVLAALPGLAGRVLACHCKPSPCSGSSEDRRKGHEGDRIDKPRGVFGVGEVDRGC